MKKLIVILIGLFLFCSVAHALEVPAYQNWVNDFANVIDDEVELQLNERISEYEERTSNEIAVVTVSSLEGDSLEGFSIKLVEKWGVGKEDKDNGIVLLFAVEEKRVRLEVGYGLEAVINDAKAGRILDDYVVEFRDVGDYTNASQNGVEGIIKAIDERLGSEGMEISEIDLPIWLIILVIIGGVIVVWFLFFRKDSWFGGGSFFSGGSSSGGSPRFGGGSFGGGGASR